MNISLEKQSKNLTADKLVEILIDANGFLWFNVDGECILRIKSPKYVLNDLRLDKFLSTSEAAELLGITTTVFRNLLQRGSIPFDCIEVVRGVRKYDSSKLLEYKDNII